MAHAELNLRERRLIEDMLHAKASAVQIARRLARGRGSAYRRALCGLGLRSLHPVPPRQAGSPPPAFRNRQRPMRRGIVPQVRANR